MSEIGKFFVTIGSQFESSGMNKAQKAILNVTKAAAVMAVAIGVKSVMAAAKFQKQLGEVSAMLDNNTMKLLPGYKRSLLDLAVKYGETTEALSKGLYDVLSAGIDASKAMYVVEASAIAAKAGLTDTGIAADGITTILNSYKLSAEDAGDVSDWFFSIVKKGKTTFQELAPNIGKVSSLAASAGLSMNDMGAALATMTKNGVRTDIAITSLRAVLNAFIKTTPEAEKAAKELGVELSVEALKADGLVPILKKLAEANTEQTASLFGSTEALTGLLAVVNDAEGFYENLEAVTNRNGAAQEAFAKVTDNLTFKLSQLWQSITRLFIIIGDELLPVVEKTTAGLRKFTDLLADDTIIKTFIAGLKAMILPIQAIIAGFQTAHHAASAFLLALAGQIKPAKKSYEAMKEAVAEFSEAVKNMTAEVVLNEKGAAVEKEEIIKDQLDQHLKDYKKYMRKKEALDKAGVIADDERRVLAESKMQFHLQKIAEHTQFWTNKSTDVVNAYRDLRIQGIQNTMEANEQAESDTYEAKKQYIMDNISDEEAKEVALSNLASEHDSNLKKLRDEGNAELRKEKQKMKRFAVAEARVKGAVGATMAYSQYGWPWGLAAAALIAAATELQVAQIEKQRFAQGGIVANTTPAILGDAGPELALPLNNPNSTRLLSRAMEAAGVGGGMGGNIFVTVPPISSRRYASEMGEVIGDAIFRKVKKSRRV